MAFSRVSQSPRVFLVKPTLSAAAEESATFLQAISGRPGLH